MCSNYTVITKILVPIELGKVWLTLADALNQKEDVEKMRL
jgi:hypothetical protein